MGPWYSDHSKVVSLSYWLIENGHISDTARDAIDVFEKPWRWSDMYRMMQREWAAEDAAEDAAA